jgi:hypothetical protein
MSFQEIYQKGMVASVLPYGLGIMAGALGGVIGHNAGVKESFDFKHLHSNTLEAKPK